MLGPNVVVAELKAALASGDVTVVETLRDETAARRSLHWTELTAR